MKKKKVKKVPKLRAWGKPTRKVMTMIIPSKKEKMQRRHKLKAELKKKLEAEVEFLKDSE